VLPPDSTGKRLRTRSRLVGGDTVHDQAVFLTAQETWFAYANAVVPAGNKHHLAIFNATGTGKVVKVRKLFAVNLQTAAVTGVVCRFDVMRITALSAGTAITPAPADTQNTALPGGITCKTAGTATEGPLLFPWVTTNEEESAVAALSKSVFQQAVNILMEGNEIMELTLREGEGMTVKQITASTVGSFGWIAVFTVE
jgi:hypothetical protein